MFDTTKRIIEFFVLLGLAIFITLAAVAWAVPAHAEPFGCAELKAVYADYDILYDEARARYKQAIAKADQAKGELLYFYWMGQAQGAMEATGAAILKSSEYRERMKLKTLECEAR